ncbi:MAG: DUF1275 domain-containing protein [Micavibrio aeruginosavorus]|uniref:DUF1275 domain-containing protein n=1 Tax=Micavibrio aeruginosavorus TaxID=349221 RepID=A0A2W5N1U8_9BACT|nr:MAG: DUF1275 domain-containing protein [Micavibrio aeruginosavorus]
MHTHDRKSRLLAAGLALLAGYVDSLGFMALGGLFVSFMSGNSTRFSVGLIDAPSIAQALLPLGIIALFVCGVMFGKVIRHLRPQAPSFSILTFMSASLLLGAMSAQAGFLWMAVPCMAIAMGAANNVFVREGEVAIGVTYMTGTLVKLGQRLAGRWLGEPKGQWRPYLFLWLALISGAVLGAVSYHYFHLSSLWGSTVFCVFLTFVVRRLDARA